MWSIEKLAKGLRANIWYNGSQPYGLAGFLNDFSSRMVGYATLRQLRVQNGKLMGIYCLFFCRLKFVYNSIFFNKKIPVKFMASSNEKI